MELQVTRDSFEKDVISSALKIWREALSPISVFAVFAQELGGRLCKLTHKRGGRNSNSREFRVQRQATRAFTLSPLRKQTWQRLIGLCKPVNWASQEGLIN